LYAQHAVDQNGTPITLVPQQMNVYAAPPMWQQLSMSSNGPMVPPQAMMAPPPMHGNGWAYTGHQYPANGAHQPQIIANGSVTAQQPQPTYGYATYSGLMHPQPTRPQPQHAHSSASSSMSSHSHHSHSHSRPHSRGSTTSTRSAASSARFGQMYTGNGGLRQKGMKGGVNSLTTLGIAQERRSTRGQSPVRRSSSYGSPFLNLTVIHDYYLVAVVPARQLDSGSASYRPPLTTAARLDAC
jgi:hypothetical protein